MRPTIEVLKKINYIKITPYLLRGDFYLNYRNNYLSLFGNNTVWSC